MENKPGSPSQIPSDLLEQLAELKKLKLVVQELKNTLTDV
jgi:predicted transcriptional regulator